MNAIRPFESDDKNDTHLFDEMQRYVLEQYPNPQRIGCLDHDTLVVFVEAPGTLDLSDAKYLHILECAACTRDLIELRQIREEEIGETKEISRSVVRSHKSRYCKWSIPLVCILACVAAILAAIRCNLRHQRSTSENQH